MLGVAIVAALALQLGGGAAPHLRAAAAGCPIVARMCVGESSTLEELRAFVKDRHLDVKTSGRGRTKATILADIRAAADAAKDVAAEAEAVAAAEAVVTADAEVDAQAAAEAEAAAAAAAAAAESIEAAKQAAAAQAAAQAAAEADLLAATEALDEYEAATIAELAATLDEAEEGGTASAPPTGFEWGGVF